MLYLVGALSFAKNPTAAGWSRAVFVVAIVGMALYLLAFAFGRERATTARTHLTVRQLFSTLFHNTPLLMVLIGSVVGFGRTIVQVGGLTFADVAYNNEGDFEVIGGSLIVGLVIAAFLTPLLLRKVSPRSAAIWSSLIAAVIYVGMYFAGFSNLLTIMIFIFLTGLTLGVFLVIQAGMIADAVDDVEKRTGVRNDGISFATLTFSSKVMAALSTWVFTIFIGIAGYQNGVHVTYTMQNIIFMSITLVPAASCLLSVIPFWFYRLGGKRQPTA
jgi:GPH family glycoside/pentoside/hexuronide:cation symporter